jgi:hypothetical protein
MGLFDAARQLLSASTPTSIPVVDAAPAKKKPKRKIKVTPAASRPAIIEEFKHAAHERGYKNITVTVLLARFGYLKRSETNLKLITAVLAEHGLTVHPALSMSLKLSQTIRIYSFPVEQLGDLFEDPETAPTAAIRQQRERALEEYIERHNLFVHLDLVKDCRQYSPKHTQDRFDFLCRDAAGTAVVLELKHAGGGKSAVEQVLRYLGMLRQEAPNRPARGILVTGVRDVDTAKALHGMTPAQQQVIDWYLYRYDRQTGALSFEKVDYDFIAHHLHRAWHINSSSAI